MSLINEFLNYANAAPAANPKPPARSGTPPAGQILVSTLVHKPIAAAIVPRPTYPMGPKEGVIDLPVFPPTPSLELVIYSDKAFAIFGDVLSIQVQLNNLYGRYNPFLKRNGVRTAGYIFSLKRLDAVKKELGI